MTTMTTRYFLPSILVNNGTMTASLNLITTIDLLLDDGLHHFSLLVFGSTPQSSKSGSRRNVFARSVILIKVSRIPRLQNVLK